MVKFSLYGNRIAILFFIMLAVAGITSMVGLLESVTAWVSERFAIHRHFGSAVVVAAVTLCSIASVLSYGVWADYRIAGFNFNDVAFAIPDKILLPAGGLLIATFAGWFMLRVHSEDELSTTPVIYSIWRQLVRYVAVPAIAFILISGLV